MVAQFNKNEAYARLQKAYSDGVAAVGAAWAAGLPDPTLPVKPPEPPPVPVIKFNTTSPKGSVSLFGYSWMVQSALPESVMISEDQKSIKFTAKSGERASFDPARKIRAELGSSKAYDKGVPITLKGRFVIDPKTVFATSQWLALLQIHQADVRYDTGVPVSGAPMFSVNLVMDNGKPMLQVRAETGLGKPVPNFFFPERELARVPITFGEEHSFEYTVVDGHGYDGSVNVVLDGKTIVDFKGATGYEYVDLVAGDYLVNGKRQATGSYAKMGIYAGLGSGEVPPEGVFVSYTFTFV